MRFTASLFAILIAVVLAGGAHGADKRSVKEVNRLAKEVQEKIISTTDAAISVRADDCRLPIAFMSNKVAFDLPLQGTKMTDTDLKDGIIIQNRSMTRTVGGPEPETFDRLLLKFGRHNSHPVKQSFENAIDACSGQEARVAILPRS